MIQAQVVRGRKGYTYSIGGKGVESHILQFDPILQYHGYKEGGNWILYHYNKFIKCWGVLEGSTKKYTLTDIPQYVLPPNLKLVMIPPDYLPNIRVRAVIMEG